ncbi:type II toxin-antitoxin system RelE/ParE family toxin [Caballeronia calidae]|uniref:type II toxin-antitoxin system RelE/ParE family toxin n=1 Tax=Caballeronia calidae TaxID=1777139 RepID=UPI0009ED8DF4
MYQNWYDRFRVMLHGEMILLHGFIKKSQALPKNDFDLAEARMKDVHDGVRYD